MPDTFEELSQRVTAAQRDVLNYVWNEYRASGIWPDTTKAHLERDMHTVEATAQELGETVLRRRWLNNDERYELTLLGVLLTDQGPEAESFLASYLDFSFKKVSANSTDRRITSTELQEQLHLGSEQLAPLFELIDMSGFHQGWTKPDAADAAWSVTVLQDVAVLKYVTDFRAYVREQAMEQYNRRWRLTQLPKRPKLHAEGMTPERPFRQMENVNFDPFEAAVWQIREQGYDIALLCTNGHVINRGSTSMLGENRDHCQDCGAETTNKCPNQTCGFPIRGAKFSLSGVEHWYRPPVSCEKCGRRYPWVKNKGHGSPGAAEGASYRSPWSSGSFYLVAFIVIVGAIIVSAIFLSLWLLPLVIIGSILVLLVVGAFQLRHDRGLDQKGFLELIGLVVKQIPGLAQLGKDKDSQHTKT